MISLGLKPLFLLILLAFAGSTATNAQTVPHGASQPIFAGGSGSAGNTPFVTYLSPSKLLSGTDKVQFYAGQALAKQPWIKAPTTTTARDGLGPLYNARTCLSCHKNGGRGTMPEDESEILSMGFIRISVPGDDHSIDRHLGVIPVPHYGDQIQTQSVSLLHQLGLPHDDASGEPAPEAKTYIRWQDHTVTFPDGEVITLRSRKAQIEELAYGPLPGNTQISIRNAPPLLGVGLLEQIPQATINRMADPEDSDGNGISGRLNRVWDNEKERWVAGRFGHKANRSDLRQVTAIAFANDIGISNPVVPKQPCESTQLACLTSADGNDREGVELPEHLLQLVTDYTRSLAVPLQRQLTPDQWQTGQQLFTEIGCAECHQPSYKTAANAPPHLANQTIWPYTDLLLHDMGEALADGRPDYDASGSEWRTAPLWGVGLSQKVNGSDHLLHDGRARGVQEAILWHGGEALKAKVAFMQLTRTQRQQMLLFVQSL